MNSGRPAPRRLRALGVTAAVGALAVTAVTWLAFAVMLAPLGEVSDAARNALLDGEYVTCEPASLRAGQLIVAVLGALVAVLAVRSSIGFVRGGRVGRSLLLGAAFVGLAVGWFVLLPGDCGFGGDD